MCDVRTRDYQPWLWARAVAARRAARRRARAVRHQPRAAHDLAPAAGRGWSSTRSVDARRDGRRGRSRPSASRSRGASSTCCSAAGFSAARSGRPASRSCPLLGGERRPRDRGAGRPARRPPARVVAHRLRPLVRAARSARAARAMANALDRRPLLVLRDLALLPVALGPPLPALRSDRRRRAAAG